MRRNCNLELRLNTTSTAEQEQQPLTIFYDGVMCVSEVTELQARTILFLASKEMEEKLKTSPTTSAAYSEPSTPNMQSSPICSPSMKKSLQTFLQKRKYRIQATSHPYHH